MDATKISELMGDLDGAENAITEGDLKLCKFFLLSAAKSAREIERELDELDGKIDNLAKRLGATTV